MLEPRLSVASSADITAIGITSEKVPQNCACQRKHQPDPETDQIDEEVHKFVAVFRPH
jgi:hypothetical protein